MNVMNAPVFASFASAMKIAVEANGKEFTTTAAEGDSAKNIQQLGTLSSRGVGGLFVWDVDTDAQRPIVKQFMDTGAATFTLSSGPATCPVVANQAEAGQVLSEAVAEVIKTKLGGKAKVVIFNLDNLVNIKPRYDQIRKNLKALGPDVEIVTDVTWAAADPDFGFKTMNTILQANPDFNVVIGDDPVVVSALAAVEAADKVRDDMFFFGGGGAEEAILKVGEQGPYKLSLAYNFSAAGYAVGQWSCDWLEGKEIPALCLVTPTVIDSPSAIDEYRKAIANPEETFKADMSKYLQPLGKISYETRSAYYNSTNPQ